MASQVSADKIASRSSGVAFTLPTADGTSGQAIVTNASGVLSFADAGPSLTGSTNTWIPTITGANALTGTANFTYDGNTLDVKNSGTASSVKLYCESSNAHYQEVKAAPHAGSSNWTLTLPPTAPSVSGQALTATTAGVGSWGSSGKVLQVIHITDAGPGTTTASASFVNTDTTGQITCSATTSKVLVMFGGSCTGYRANDSNQANGKYRLYETATSTAYPGTDFFARGVGTWNGNEAGNRFGSYVGGTWLHSPASVAQLTYTVQIAKLNDSTYWNETADETATMTLMEIGA